MKSFIYIPAFFLLVLSGCKVSKDVTLPASPAPEVFRDAKTVDSIGIASIEWKQFFTNESLLQLIDSAINRNYDLQLAIKNIEAAQLVLSQSKLGNLPTVSLQASASINRPSDNSLNGLSLSQFLGKSYVEDYNVSAAISWEADIWGKIKNQKARALAEFLQTGEARKMVQTNLVATVANGYYNLLLLDAQVAIARRNLILSDSTLRIIQLQYDAGQVSLLGVEQAEAQKLVAASLVPQLEQAITIQENALSILTSVSPASIKRNGTINDDALVNNNLATGVPSLLLQNRPDIRQLEYQLNIANANTGIARAEMYPSLKITAAGGVSAFKASNWFNIPASLFATALGSVTQPIFQRKELRTKYELAKVDREKTVIQFRQSVLTAVGEVSDELVKVNKLEEQRAIANTRVEVLQKAIQNANLLFKNGMANYLEVITAQSNVLQSELELAALKKQQVNAVIGLYRALGGGWR